jgi:hypothetical protein
MSTILYYSNHCNSSKQVLQILSKFDLSNEIHFVCIDNRLVKNGKKFAVLPNGQEMLIPDNITVVPALLVLTQQYNVIYGNNIINYFKSKIGMQIDQATNNNKIPSGLPSSKQSARQPTTGAIVDKISEFSGFGNFGGIVSDQYSFLDQNDTELGAKGDGGLRQMHNYAMYGDDNLVSTSVQQSQQQQQQQTQQSDKIKEGEYTLDQLKQARDQDLQRYGPKMAYGGR